MKEEKVVSLEERKLIACRLIDEADCKGNLAAVDEWVTPDVVLHIPPGPDVRSVEGWKKHVIAWRTSFPDTHITPDDVLGEGDKVIVRWSDHATHKGDWAGFPPSGKKISMTGVAIYRFVGNRIAEVWGCRDALGMMRQMGVLPQPQHVSK